MIRLVTLSRLTKLEASLIAAEALIQRLASAEQRAQVQLELVKQARDHYKAEAEKWERRASKFIDQAHLKAGTIDAPVMTELDDRPRDPKKRVMAALNVTEINTSRQDVPHTAAVQGVNEEAVQRAIGDVFPSEFAQSGALGTFRR